MYWFIYLWNVCDIYQCDQGHCVEMWLQEFFASRITIPFNPQIVTNPEYDTEDEWAIQLGSNLLVHKLISKFDYD